MEQDASMWSRTNIFILAICIEHLVIALKVVIALAIPDVPKNVKDAEKRRITYEEQAWKELRREKRDRNAVDIEDLEDESHANESKMT